MKEHRAYAYRKHDTDAVYDTDSTEAMGLGPPPVDPRRGAEVRVTESHGGGQAGDAGTLYEASMRISFIQCAPGDAIGRAGYWILGARRTG